MLSAPAVDRSFIPEGDEAWKQNNSSTRPASMGGWGYGSYGVTSIGRGFDWQESDEASQDDNNSVSLGSFLNDPSAVTPADSNKLLDSKNKPMRQFLASSLTIPPHPILTGDPLTLSPASASPSPSSRPPSANGSARPPLSRSPSTPRPRRRSSQQRVSLIAGRVSIAVLEPSSPAISGLSRADSVRSYLSSAASTAPPSPTRSDSDVFSPSGRDISAFEIEQEIGRGAYGLVKRAREKKDDGSLGPPLVIKQIIKSRILADCWKKHPKYGTIPIEIYVLSSVSNTSYTLPKRRPWSPFRPKSSPDALDVDPAADDWVEGGVVKGHPNICPILEFFEDSHYYYLVSPSTVPDNEPDQQPQPSDLFDLVENYPTGLPPWFIRTYLGQIADALCFLHTRGIVHRDIKDENVVLGKDGRCILIDFGSSGLVKKSGWDTFSGTLDYAGPEILRGERYYGKEQDVWAFGVVAYVLLVGECPFTSPTEAQEGLGSPFTNASMALDERCADGKDREGEEADGGGALGDAAALVRACLQVDVSARPTFERILQSRFLSGGNGWGADDR